MKNIEAYQNAALTIVDEFAYSDMDIDTTGSYLEACMSKYLEVDPSVFSEGTIRDYRNTQKEAIKEVKKSLKILRKYAKKPSDKNEEAFNTEAKKAHELIKKYKNVINDIPSDVTSVVLGWIYLGFVDVIKGVIPALISLGLSVYVQQGVNLIQFIQGAIAAVKGEETIAEGLDQVRQRAKLVIAWLESSLVAVEKLYKKNKAKEDAKKTNEVKESVNNVFNAYVSGKIDEDEMRRILQEC